MNKKYAPLLPIIGVGLIMVLLRLYNEHSRTGRSHKSSEHNYMDKYCSLTIPENWTDSIIFVPNAKTIINATAPNEEATIIISINKFAADTFEDLNDYESRFHKSLLENYSKKYFTKWGIYEGKGMLMTGALQNKIEGFVKVFIYADSINSFYVIEVNSYLEHRQLNSDLEKMEASFRLQ